MQHDQVPAPASDQVVNAVLSASRVLVAVAARSLAGVGEEVTLAQYRTLVVLASRGPQSLASLAEAVAVTPATATRMCDRLVRKDLVRRRVRAGQPPPGAADFDASPAGSSSTRVTARRRAEIERIVSEMPADEQTVLVQALGRLAAVAGEVPEQDWTTGWDL